MTEDIILESCFNEYVREHEYVRDHMTNVFSIIAHLEDKKLENGVCSFIVQKFGFRTITAVERQYPWIKKYLRTMRDGRLPKDEWQSPTHWAAVPSLCTTKEQILETMQIRINILRKEMGVDQ